MSDREHYGESLREKDAWLAQFRRFWSAFVDALERYLDRMNEDPSTQAKTKTGKTKTTRRRR